MAYLLVSQVELLQTLAILQSLEATDTVVFEVELAKLCALFKAVHLTYQVIVEIYLYQACEASQSAAHVCEEVILQV